MKFRYYIYDLSMGEVSGSNDKLLAEELSESDDLAVIDSEGGSSLYDGEYEEIQVYKDIRE